MAVMGIASASYLLAGFALCAISALVLSKTSSPEDFYQIASSIIAVASPLCAGAVCAALSSEAGLIRGLIVGAAAGIVLSVCSALAGDIGIGGALLRFSLSVVLSAVGAGIVAAVKNK